MVKQSIPFELHDFGVEERWRSLAELCNLVAATFTLPTVLPENIIITILKFNIRAFLFCSTPEIW